VSTTRVQPVWGGVATIAHARRAVGPYPATRQSLCTEACPSPRPSPRKRGEGGDTLSPFQAPLPLI
jgi:hypothetical protein